MRAITMLISCVAFLIVFSGCNLEYAALSEAEEAATEEQEETTEPDADATDEPQSEPEEEPTPTPEPEFAGADWMERGRLTVLISGTDAASDRDASRTDAMMVASLNLETGQPVIFGVPRNYADLPLPEEVASVMGIEEFTGMLGWLYPEAQAYPDLAPEGGDPGMVAVKGAISELLDIHIDYYATVDMTGFVQLVDAFGGIDVNVHEPLTVRLLSPIEGEGWQQFEIAPGEQTLNGHQALAYARSRTGSSDYDRMERQRCLARSLAEQADIQTLVTTFPELTDVIRENVTTDIPLDMLPDMIMLREEVRMDQLVTVGFDPPEYLAGRSSEGHNLPATERIRETVRQALETPSELQEQGAGDAAEGRHC